MTPGVVGDLLDRVGVGVPVVENLPQAGFGEILPHDGGLDRDGPGDQVGQHWRVPGQAVGGIGQDPVENDRVGDQAALDDLSESGPQLSGRQSGEHLQVGDDGGRRVEGTHQVLACRRVDSRLTAHGGVHHGQKRGGHLNHGNTSQPGRGRETGQVRRRSATESDDEPVTAQAEGAEPLPQVLRDARLLGRFPIGDLEAQDAQPLGGQRRLGSAGAVGQRLGVDDGDATRTCSGDVLHDAGQLGQDPVADEDVVGARAADGDPPCAAAALGGCHGPDADAPWRAVGPVRSSGRVCLRLGHGSQDTDCLRGLDPQGHQDESGDLLGTEPISGHGQRGDLGVQRRALSMEGLHPRQDARVLALLLTALLSGTGLVRVRVRGHDRAPGPVPHVLGRSARRGGQVDDRVTAQQVSVLRAQHRSPAQGDDTLSGRRGVQDCPHGPVLAVAEALLPLGGEDLWDRHAGAPADLSVGVSDLDAQGLGQEPGLSGLARAGQPHQNQGQLVVAQSDGRNTLPGHDRDSLSVEIAVGGISIARAERLATRFTARFATASVQRCGPGRNAGCVGPRQPSLPRSCPVEDRPGPGRSWPVQ